MPPQAAQTRRETRQATMIGLDIGTNRAPSGLAVVELEWRIEGETRDTHFHVRFLETLPAGVRYPDLAERLVEIHEKIRQRDHKVWSLFVNATGIGDPVLELIRKALPRIELIPVYFNHGDRRTETEGVVKLGKAWLVSRLKTLLQAHRLHLPESAEARTLATELSEFEVKVHPKANDHYGAFQVGQRDELVTALGLATQLDERGGTTLLHLMEGWGPVSEWHPDARPRRFQRSR